jgi:hypothetical protein
MPKCLTPYCKNRIKTGKYCSTCRYKKWREAHPVKYAFLNLKHNAKKRGVLFTITFEDFKQWCTKVKYIGFTGRSSDSLTIDRRYNDIGYHIDNIQVMTRHDNVVKYVHYDYRVKRVTYTTPEPVTADEDEDLPF